MTSAVPANTYRLQITEDFDLFEATRRLPYLHDLGVDWVYLSPLLSAEQGSSHGYDVVDFTRVDASRGGGEGMGGRHGCGRGTFGREGDDGVDREQQTEQPARRGPAARRNGQGYPPVLCPGVPIRRRYFSCSCSGVSGLSTSLGMQSTGQTSTHCGLSKWPTHSVHRLGSMT